MRRTDKFVKARALAAELARKSRANPIKELLNISDREQLYQKLNEHHYYWNFKVKQWEELTFEDADPPTEVIRIRIWTDSRYTKDIAEELISSLAAKGLRCVSKSTPYPCRKPNQLESIIYLDFLKNPELDIQPENGSAVLGTEHKKGGH
ncbi:MAG: hypothetical protein RIG63_16810 [Coleofasciculus chthonoplastes F3-SA18-01]|uniref:hypothetical protein n=1 Tax=Coleofasciculus chthonoplastes TaxID=64178 RepID=UPI0032F9EA5D